MEPWQERASPKDQCVLLAFTTGNRCKLKAIGNEARSGDADVAINGEDALASPRKQQLADDKLLHSNHDTVSAPHAQNSACTKKCFKYCSKYKMQPFSTNMPTYR